MSLPRTLRFVERARDAYWRRAGASSLKLRWRAVAVRHLFHVRPGESILVVGAGSGLWTEHLVRATRGENPITAAVFDRALFDAAMRRHLANTRVVLVQDLDDLPAASFDYVVGDGVLSNESGDDMLRAAYRLVRPGGQVLAFEANAENPLIRARTVLSGARRSNRRAHPGAGLRRADLVARAGHHGFVDAEIVPFDILPSRMNPAVVRALQSAAFVVEHAPVVRELSSTVYVWLTKPGAPARRMVNLANHAQLDGAVSVVVPCHNEEMNVGPFAAAMFEAYGPYLHEMLFVDDNSTDRTADVVSTLAAAEPRIRLVRRTPPNGVGRALRDGFAAATGRYILTMDCDFVVLVPELRDLFDQVAAGRDGAIGSRFSYESMLVNYPFFKVLCNRAFHALVRLTLRRRVRDLSNNLKIYRAEILKTIAIESPHFAANVETGLRPLLAGYDVVEVPISWIGRTAGMGASSFRIARVGPGYFAALVRILWQTWGLRRRSARVVHGLGAARGSAHRG